MDGLSGNIDGNTPGLSSRCRLAVDALFMYRKPRRGGLPFLKSKTALRGVVVFSAVRLLRQVSNP
jgi:hypothetical protein